MFYSNPVTRQRSVNVPGLYHTHHGDVFLPGAGNVVFEPAFGLPPQVVQGPSVIAGNAYSPLQPPPQIFVTQAAPVAGMGGLIAGQWITQPLNVPETTNGTQ